MATYTGSCGKYTIILNVSEVSSSVDVGSNTSKVSWSLQFRADTAYCQWNPGPGDFEVKINGASVWSAQNPGLMFGGSGQTLTLASGTSGAITHNSDGTKTVSCQAIYTQNSTANYLPSSGSCSGNLALSTIPRASSFSSIIGDVIGGSQTINIDRKSSNFTNNLWYRVGDEDWVSIGTGIETSKTWTLPISLNNKIPNATSLTLTYLLRTYNGSTQIGGDVTYNFNVNYSGEKPTAGTATITYSKLFNNKFIANYSSGTINYSGYDGIYGSTIKNAQVIFNGSWKGVTSYSTGLLTAGTHTFQGVVTDSRENTSYTTQQSFTCYQINNPTVSINAYRSDSSGNANPSGTYITIIPTYSAHDPVGGNSIKSSSFTCTSLMTTGTAIASGSKKILSGAATDSQYVISGTVTDQLGRTSATSVQIGTAFALWDVRPDQRGMAFGKYSTGTDKFEVAWDAYFDGKVNSNSINSDNVNSKYYYKKPFLQSQYQEGDIVNTWHKVADIKLTYRYQDCSLKLYLEWSGQGYKSSFYANLLLRVKQQNAMGDSPEIELIVEKSSNSQLSYDCFVVNKVEFSISLTHVQLWVRNPIYYSSINYYYKNSISNSAIELNTHTSYEIDAPSNILEYGKDRILDLIYPIGSIYISANSTNPSEFIGGTWIQFGQGRTLVGVDTFDSNFNTVEKTGGEATHKLTLSEMPKHTHTAYSYTTNHEANGYGLQGGAAFANRVMVSGNHATSSSGNDGSHNNLQPYITVYFWKRTA